MPDCKECRQRIERPEKLATTDYRVRKLKLMFRNARIRAKRRGLPFDLDEQWIMDMFGNQRVCPIMSHSGEDYELDWYSKFIVDRSPSLDRVDNSKGYTKDNVWVISQLANKMKNNASLDQLRCFASFWLSILGDVPIHMTQSSRR
jgi:hypothetical protein